MARRAIAGSLTVLWLSILPGPTSSGQQAGSELAKVQNAGFEDGKAGRAPPGWFVPDVCIKDGYAISTSEDRPCAGNLCAVISRGARERPTSIGNLMQSIPAKEFRGRRVRFKAAVRTEVSGAGNRAQLWFRVDRPNQQSGFFDNMGDRPITAKEWKQYEIVGDVADDAESIVCGMFLFGSGSAAVDEVAIEVVEATVPTTGVVRVSPAPGLTDVRMASTVRAKGGAKTTTYLYPLPLSYRDQAPLSFQLRVKPSGAAKSAEIIASQGENRVLRLTLQELDKHKEVEVSYSSVVLVGPTRFDSAPPSASFPSEWPAEARAWLQPTWCCDYKNERIKKLCAQIRGDGDDVMPVIANVLATARETFTEAEGNVTNLTAVEALDKRGSCTSCANLVAALLRGSGVPARILSGYPLWSGPLQTHYIVEAYVPGFGWYPVESTRCQSPWPNHQQINVSIVPIEHESQAKAGKRVTGAGGVPYLSLTEMEGLQPTVYSVGTLNPRCDHECRMIRQIVADDAEWAAALDWARPRWNDWLRSTPKLQDGRLSFGLDSAAAKAKTLDEVRAEFE